MQQLVLTQGRPRRSRTVVSERRGGTSLLVDGATGATVEVNDTAMAIWELCDGETTPTEMVAGICALFATTADVVTRHVEQVLATLAQAGFVDWLPGGAPA